jgi:hypothetical protein
MNSGLNDRQWFCVHPVRFHRDRLATPTEIDDLREHGCFDGGARLADDCLIYAAITHQQGVRDLRLCPPRIHLHSAPEYSCSGKTPPPDGRNRGRHPCALHRPRRRCGSCTHVRNQRSSGRRRNRKSPEPVEPPRRLGSEKLPGDVPECCVFVDAEDRQLTGVESGPSATWRIRIGGRVFLKL